MRSPKQDMRVRIFSRAYIQQELHLRCQSLAANDNRGFRQEFQELKDVGKELTSRIGNLEANREKNRYPYILPYDHCRVRLSLQESRPYSDYINASFVPGGGSERDFICTQGPLHNTTADFWRMVWEQNVRIIVMVTALRHKDTVLCDQYWPLEQGTVCYGLVQVTTLCRKKGPDYFITTINLRRRGCSPERIVTHYHYPTWPDQGVPKDRASLCNLTEHVRQHLEAIPHLGPTVVHCSAGIGRSGAFVTLLWLMQLCMRGIQPDIRGAVGDLRRHRMWMVQNLDQYVLVHWSLLHWLSGKAGGTPTRGLKSKAFGVNTSQTQDQLQSSSGHADRGRHQHGRHDPPSEQPQSPMQHLLHPGKLLRRLMSSSLQLNQHSHT
ncbi:receptor-type tyrosine-protein phosphatase beta-like [Lampris incognitus]|uniref:receptor-type tyrosine-protein phosphatase beta-like n=1 Tax=Lampris incognitus TaxID=2546036 RepID=UPI0024B4BC95|nr:receptor-type tyrosine-protein phosphatase beta-like [Lampris incognitus]